MHRATICEVALEGLLRRDRDPLRVELEVAGIDPAGAIAEQPADLAREECPELRLGERRQLADPLHACAGEPLLGARPDPGEEPRR